MFVGGKFLEVDGDEDLFSFGVNVADVDTALVCEENPVALRMGSQLLSIGAQSDASYISDRVDVDVVLRIGRVRNERLDKELSQRPDGGLNLDFLASSSLDPRPCLGPCLVQGQQTALASSLDQLVWFGDQFHAGSK